MVIGHATSAFQEFWGQKSLSPTRSTPQERRRRHESSNKRNVLPSEGVEGRKNNWHNLQKKKKS